MRTLVALALVTAVVGIVSGAERKSVRPLDLPSGGRGSAEDEEDAPESIRFFDGTYEGDGFFFLLDKSGSMFGTAMELLAVEMGSALRELSQSNEFGIVAFSGDTQEFSMVPLPGGEPCVSFAHAWVEGLVPYGPTMMLAAAEEILAIANLSTREFRHLIVVGDGLPNNPGPEETLAGIIELDTEGLPIHTILLGSSPPAVEFMSALASQTGGTFRSVPW